MRATGFAIVRRRAWQAGCLPNQRESWAIARRSRSASLGLSSSYTPTAAMYGSRCGVVATIEHRAWVVVETASGSMRLIATFKEEGRR
jgi:hypothetical protein